MNEQAIVALAAALLVIAVCVFFTILYIKHATGAISGLSEALNDERRRRLDDMAEMTRQHVAALSAETARADACQALVASQQRTLMQAFANQKPTKAAAGEALHDSEAIAEFRKRMWPGIDRRMNGVADERPIAPVHNIPED